VSGCKKLTGAGAERERGQRERGFTERERSDERTKLAA